MKQISAHDPARVVPRIERDPVAFPYVSVGISGDRLPATTLQYEIECHDLRFCGTSSEPIAWAVAAISLYLGRLCGNEAFALDLSHLALSNLPQTEESSFATNAPLAIQLNWRDSFTEHVAHLEDLISAAAERGTVAVEPIDFCPQIEAQREKRSGSIPDVAVAVVSEDAKDATGLPPAHLVFAIAQSATKITLIANADAIEKELLTKIAEELKHLLTRADADPDCALADFEIVRPRERAILEGWNGEGSPEYEPSILSRVFEAQVDRTPNATALVFREESLTYRELNARANQLARLLVARGIKKGDLVGVLMERSIESVVTLLGALKAGAVFVPLDPIYPLRRLALTAKNPKTQRYLSFVELRWMHRLAAMAQDAKPKLIVTQERHLDRVPKVGAQTVIFDGPDALAGLDAENLETPIDPEDLAYVMYTFGSTGRLKGVMITHANVDHFLTAIDGPMRI